MVAKVIMCGTIPRRWTQMGSLGIHNYEDNLLDSWSIFLEVPKWLWPVWSPCLEVVLRGGYVKRSMILGSCDFCLKSRHQVESRLIVLSNTLSRKLCQILFRKHSYNVWTEETQVRHKEEELFVLPVTSPPGEVTQSLGLKDLGDTNHTNSTPAGKTIRLPPHH